MQKQKNNLEDKALDEINLSFDKLFAGGFIVICLIILQVFVTATPDVAIYISLGSVAIVIPLLVGYFVLITLQEKGAIKAAHWVAGNIIERTAMAGTIVAVDAALWHVHWLIGVAFLASAIVTTIVFSTYVSHNSNIRVWFFGIK